jgi:hypothetical protein
VPIPKIEEANALQDARLRGHRQRTRAEADGWLQRLDWRAGLYAIGFDHAQGVTIFRSAAKGARLRCLAYQALVRALETRRPKQVKLPQHDTLGEGWAELPSNDRG